LDEDGNIAFVTDFPDKRTSSGILNRVDDEEEENQGCMLS
jgi:hypothetical protein